MLRDARQSRRQPPLPPSDREPTSRCIRAVTRGRYAFPSRTQRTRRHDGTRATLSTRKAVLRRQCAVLPENGVGMPKIVITHNVADVAKWLGFKS